MREETRKRLERAILMQRLKLAVGGLAAALAVASVFWLESKDAAVENRTVAGVVESVGPLSGKRSFSTLSSNVAVEVKLSDGRLAQVVTNKDTSPHVGDHVEIAEHIHGTGRRTFTWK